MSNHDGPSLFSRRRLLKLGSAAAVVAVVAGLGGYIAYQSSQKPTTPIVTQTTQPALETFPTTAPSLTPAPARPTEQTAPSPVTTSTPASSTLTAPETIHARTWGVPEDYPTISEAIAATSPGDTIQVGPGTYPGFITIAKSLTVKGSGAGVTIIDGLIRIHTHGARLTGFTVKGGGEVNFHAAVIISVDGGNEVSGNTIESTGDGVHIHSGDNKVSNNIIKTAGAGVAIHAEIGDGINNKIVGNSIEGGEIGVIINVVGHQEVRGNTIRLSEVGILLSPYQHGIPIVENTIFENNLIDNKVQAQDDGSNNVWYKDGKGNYWSNWTGPDDNKDGIVDKPYLIAGTAKSVDKYPLAATTEV